MCEPERQKTQSLYYGERYERLEREHVSHRLASRVISHGNLKQMATYLTGTSTCGITTSGSITALVFRALQEAHWYQSVVRGGFSYHKQ